jgi:diguanylate cyclase (GGDEF)-like protein
VARLGGDEFVVLVPSVGGAVEAEGVRDRIAAAVESTPVVAGSEEIHLRASIGIARYPEDGDDPATLLQQADLSMYRSKVARSSADA